MQAWLIAHNVKDWTDIPGMITPLDHDDSDTSVYGIRHVAKNAPEMLLPRGQRVPYAPKIHAANLDPYLSMVAAQWNFIASSTGSADSEASLPVSGNVRKRVADLQPDDSLGWAGLFVDVSFAEFGAILDTRDRAVVANRNGRGGTAGSRTGVSTASLNLGAKRLIEPGFRCAD